MAHLDLVQDDRVLVGPSTLDDAGVYRLDGGPTIVQTVDFFTPVVNDPEDYGRVAVANALSDVYAMGGRPLTALGILCYPHDRLPKEVLGGIMRGASRALREAGVVLLGGHSVRDPELKFGLAVTGTVEPDHILTNAGGRPGDVLILTKPLGTGVLSTALKAGKLDGGTEELLVETMVLLNRSASELAVEAGVHACVDVTGFALAGHGAQLAQASGITMVIDVPSLPLLPRALELAARKRYLTGGDRTNREYLAGRYEVTGQVESAEEALCFDPQTSGGLLLAVSPDGAESLLGRLKEAGWSQAAIVGRLAPREGDLLLRLQGR